jgi:hypothetical protein
LLGGAFSQAQRMFLPIRRDPQRHDQTVLTNVHAVEDQDDEVERVQRRGLPGGSLRGRLRHEPAADTALLVPRLPTPAGTSFTLRA